MNVQAALATDAVLVASLSTEIGRRLGLTGSEGEGLLLGALLHDIGLLTVSARTLHKRARLTKDEYAFVRQHCAIGRDLISGVHFPWPIDRIVLEHHERWDGSGYPNGLSNDDICLEARIIGVADVVVAIARERPYRPALGRGAAIDEIALNGGRLYDPDVAHVCLAILSGDPGIFSPDDDVYDRAGELWERVLARTGDRRAAGTSSAGQTT